MKKALLVCLAALSFPALAALPDAPLPYRVEVLPNGLTLLVHADHKAPLVAMHLWYRVGSADESPGKTGFAHLFEHLMFNGSQHHDDEYFRPLEAAGASDINGTTNTDRTNFYATVPKEALDLALWLESDRMGHLLPAITQAKLDEQRGVVKNEKRQREGQPYAKAYEVIAQSSYPAGHPYSWTTIGSMEDLDHASLADVQQWFKTYYGPGNAVLALAGDISFDEARAKVGKAFGSIPATAAVAHRDAWPAPMVGPQRRTLYDRVTQARITRLWNLPPRGNPDSLALAIGADVLASDKASRLYKRLVTQTQLATAVSADVDESLLGSQFSIDVTAKQGADLVAIEAILDEEVGKLTSEPAPQAQLERIKTSVYVARLNNRESIAAKAAELAACQAQFGDMARCEGHFKTLIATTPAQIASAAKTWLGGNHLTVTVLPEPPTPPLNNIEVDRSQLPAVGEPQGIALPPLSSFTLANGLTVHLAERHEVPMVHLSLFWPYGTASQPDAGQMEMLFGMLGEGAGALNAEQLTEAYGTLGARVGNDLDSDAVSTQLSVPRANLEGTLKLWLSNLTAPTFPADALARRKARKLAGLNANTSSPQGILGLNQYRLLYGDHPYGRFNSLPRLQAATSALSPAALQALLPQAIRPDTGQLLVVGDIDAASLKTLLDASLGQWPIPSVAPLASALPPVPANTPHVYLFNVPGAAQTLIAASRVAVPVTHPQHDAMSVANAVLGGLFTSRLNLNLRELHHWTYGASSGLGEARGPALFYAQAQVETAQTAPALREAAKEIRELASTRPPTTEEITQARKSLVRALPAEAETASGVLGLYQRQLGYQLPADTYASTPQRLAALTPAQVADAARELVKPGELNWFVVGDLAQIEANVRALNLGPVTVLDAAGQVLR